MRQRQKWFDPDTLAPLYRIDSVGPLVVALGVPTVATGLAEKLA
ncbi:MAG: hypothetical protein ABEI98_00995 [Halorhabdus sp.]